VPRTLSSGEFAVSRRTARAPQTRRGRVQLLAPWWATVELDLERVQVGKSLVDWSAADHSQSLSPCDLQVHGAEVEAAPLP